MEVYGSIWKYMVVYGKYMEVYGSTYGNNEVSIWKDIMERRHSHTPHILYSTAACLGGKFCSFNQELNSHRLLARSSLVATTLKSNQLQ